MDAARAEVVEVDGVQRFVVFVKRLLDSELRKAVAAEDGRSCSESQWRCIRGIRRGLGKGKKATYPWMCVTH